MRRRLGFQLWEPGEYPVVGPTADGWTEGARHRRDLRALFSPNAELPVLGGNVRSLRVHRSGSTVDAGWLKLFARRLLVISLMYSCNVPPAGKENEGALLARVSET